MTRAKREVVVEVGAVKSRIVEAPPEAIQLLREELTIPVPNAQHTTLFKQGRWDGNHRFLRAGAHTFDTGLMTRVRGILKKMDLTVEIVPDNCNALLFNPLDIKNCLHGITLRDYQIETVHDALTKGYPAGRMAIQCPTGGGKTEIGAAIIKLLRRPTLWLVHRKELLLQTHARLVSRIRPKDDTAIGMMGAGIKSPAFVTVGMVQTLKDHPKEFFGMFRILIVDEVHHISAETWYDLAAMCENAWWRFGLSGTVVTGDRVRDLKLEGATGPVYVVAGTMELAEKGFLAKPRIRMMRLSPGLYPSYEWVRQTVCPGWRRDPRQLKTMGAKLFATAYRAGITENKDRNEWISKIACSHWMRGRKVLVLCTKIAHGKRIVQHALDGKDMKVRGLWWLHGSESDKVREKALAEFKESKFGGVMIASTIFDEGIDIPEIDVLILAGGGESMVKSIQRVGRALRPREDKDHVLIYDFLDGRGDHPKDYLMNHSLRRMQDYRDQGFKVEEV